MTIAGAIAQGLLTTGAVIFAFAHLDNNGVLEWASLRNNPDFSLLVVYSLNGFSIGVALFLTSHFKAQRLERRLSGRYYVDTPVRILLGGNFCDAQLISISEGGFLLSALSLDMEKGLEVTIELEGEAPLKGTVIATERGETRVRYTTPEDWPRIKRYFDL